MPIKQPKRHEVYFASKGKARTYADKRAQLGYKVLGIFLSPDLGGYIVIWQNVD